MLPMTRWGTRKTWIGLVLGATLLAAAGARGVGFSVTNSAFITINDSLNPPTPASPYPSTNTVSGWTGLVVGKVTVTLRGFSHVFPSDVYILLVGPQGQAALLLGNVGGTQIKYSVTNLTLTLDDGAASYLPVYSTLTNGTFKPTNGYLIQGHPSLPFDFPAPAPPGNSNAVAALSVFRNTDPNGAWRLFVVDDVAGDAGSISAGWSLNITAGIPLAIVRTPTAMVLSWTNAVSGCVLQSTPSLSTGWTNVPTTPVVVAGRYTVTNPIVPGGSFYRLIK